MLPKRVVLAVTGVRSEFFPPSGGLRAVAGSLTSGRGRMVLLPDALPIDG